MATRGAIKFLVVRKTASQKTAEIGRWLKPPRGKAPTGGVLIAAIKKFQC